jgi:hypothetical protein
MAKLKENRRPKFEVKRIWKYLLIVNVDVRLVSGSCYLGQYKP